MSGSSISKTSRLKRTISKNIERPLNPGATKVKSNNLTTQAGGDFTESILNVNNQPQAKLKNTPRNLLENFYIKPMVSFFDLASRDLTKAYIKLQSTKAHTEKQSTFGEKLGKFVNDNRDALTVAAISPGLFLISSLTGCSKPQKKADIKDNNTSKNSELSKSINGLPVVIKPSVISSLPDAEEIISNALKVVSENQISSSNYFSKIGNSPCKNTKFTLNVVNFNDVPSYAKYAIPSGDALTVAQSKKDNSQHTIDIYLVADRLMRDQKTGQPTDVTARAIAALGHEIYGNVDSQCERISKKIDWHPSNRKAGEVNAFTVGVQFLQTVISSEGFKSLPQAQQNELINALNREKSGLAFWKNQ